MSSSSIPREELSVLLGEVWRYVPSLSEEFEPRLLRTMNEALGDAAGEETVKIPLTVRITIDCTADPLTAQVRLSTGSTQKIEGATIEANMTGELAPDFGRSAKPKAVPRGAATGTFDEEEVEV